MPIKRNTQKNFIRLSRCDNLHAPIFQISA